VRCRGTRPRATRREINRFAPADVKMGPSFKDVAAKYKGKADAADALYKHVTTGPMVKIGTKEQKHAVVKSSDEAAIKNMVAYILSR
jgi:cytochrome c